MLGEDNNTEGSLAELAKWLILINSLVEEALSSEDLLMPVLHSLLTVEVDRSLLGVGADEVDAEFSSDA